MLGRAVQGLALVASGAVAEGMRALDEVNAAVVAGELHDLVAIGLSCCYMIAACDRVRDYDRAMQWCTRLKAFCAKWGLRPLFAVCRTQYASICMWRGTWLEAEQELTAATDELAASRPAMTADGVVRLAELRRRQGRLVEAAALFEQAEPHRLALARPRRARVRSRRPAAPPRSRPRATCAACRRTTGPIAPPASICWCARWSDRRHRRRAHRARRADRDRRRSSTRCRCAARRAGGGTRRARRRATRRARRHFEDAVDLFLQSGAPYEAGARADRAGARARRARPRDDARRDEAQRAIDLLAELKAELEMARARALLDGSPPRAGAGDRPPTRRPDRARDRGAAARRRRPEQPGDRRALFVSEHTVHRHVANIFSKLSVSSRAAAVAQAARRGMLNA